MSDKRYEIRIPLPDLDNVADRIERASDSMREFEKHPPRWFLIILAMIPFMVTVLYRVATMRH